MKSQVIFRADASKEIGLGHFNRCMVLAKAIHQKFDCYFAAKNPSDSQISEIHGIFEGVIKLNDDDSHFLQFLDMLKGTEIVVLDNYYFDSSYQKKIKEKGCKLICIDDLADKHFFADAIINHAPGAESFSFDKEPYSKIYGGLNYLMLREEFSIIDNKSVAKEKLQNGFICMGGGDAQNFTLKVIETLEKRLNSVLKLDVVIGSQNNNREVLKKVSNSFSEIVFHDHLSAEEMIFLIKKSDFAVVPPSTLSLECAKIHIPLFLLQTADNQKRIFEFLIQNQCAMKFEDIGTYNIELGEEMIKNQAFNFHGSVKENLLAIFEEIENKC
ncbi:MAG: UDP-2,4-diacetamido-2,4,6-trideoxy-beta-L-altropyranose hydrolase [Bacteroidetes bacterium]|nr:UDP-2,4-diacetamido-2,4,6-trideoxy-beta-L-altropyranose hydrolase [Bacteroidota bacterium]